MLNDNIEIVKIKLRKNKDRPSVSKSLFLKKRKSFKRTELFNFKTI